MSARRQLLQAHSVSELKKIADKLHSEWIRKKDAKDGFAQCFTCGVTQAWKQLQCGHYISRSHNQLRYDPRNTHVQCLGCNIFRHGNMDEYARALIQKYGTKILETLAKEKRKIKQFTKKDLIKIIEQTRSRLEKLIMV